MGTSMRILASLLVMVLSAQAAPLPYIEDDWPRALAEAQRTHRPIFVDDWVPW
jgi:hypothetical protein